MQVLARQPSCWKILQDKHFLKNSCKSLQDQHLVVNRVSTSALRILRSFPFVSPQCDMRPQVTEHVPLHSKSLRKNMTRESESANNMRPLRLAHSPQTLTFSQNATTFSCFDRKVLKSWPSWVLQIFSKTRSDLLFCGYFIQLR